MSLYQIKNRIKSFLESKPALSPIYKIARYVLIQFRRLKVKIHGFWQKLGFHSLLLEEDLFRPKTQKKSLKDQIGITVRYRAAKYNIAFTNNEHQLLKLKNKHAGERAFLIGNGPSLNKCDLTFLKDEITFGANAIFLNKDKMGFYPKYYIVEDVAVAEDRGPEIDQFHGPDYKFFGNYLDYCFAPAKDVLWLNVRLNYDDEKLSSFPNFSTNAGVRVWVGGTVSYIGMQLAYYLGITTLYLIGFDHSYSIPDSVKIKGKQFTSTEDDPNHFHPDYFGKGYRWHDPNVDRMERSYWKAKHYYEKDGRKIYNATVGGHLEVFERVDYNKLFE